MEAQHTGREDRMMERLLQNKNVIITGTTRGIGHTMLRVFAAHGACVIAHARKQTKEHLSYCEKVASDYGTLVYPVYFDLRDTTGIQAAVKQIRNLKIPVHGLVNNAGTGSNTLFQMTRMKELREVFEVDFFGPYLFTQYISKLMVRQGSGSIVSISSTSALDGNSGKSGYGAAKAALITMTKSIAEELGVSGIRANAICPGVVDTDAIRVMPDYIIEIEKKASYLGRLADTEDIAQTAVFLVSDYSAYMTGQVIRAAGGKPLYQKRKDE